jgi:hypothetical protein
MDYCIPDDTDWTCAQAAHDEMDPELLLRSETLAWLTLQMLTGYALDICPVTVRPCKKLCTDGTWTAAPVSAAGTFTPNLNVSGQWVNTCTCGGNSCSCGPIHEIILPGPVGDIVEVQIDGAPLSPSAYRIDNFTHLVRQDGGVWPDCQDMNLPNKEVGTFSVTYYGGAKPDSMTKYAAGVLAYEFSKACAGGKCRLPSGVTQITRQGVTMEIQQGMFPNGFTGIREVDVVIGLFNPNGLRSPVVIASPDYNPGRKTTWSR